MQWLRGGSLGSSRSLPDEEGFAFDDCDTALTEADEFEKGEEPPDGFGSGEGGGDEGIEGGELIGEGAEDDFDHLGHAAAGPTEDGGFGDGFFEEALEGAGEVVDGGLVEVEGGGESGVGAGAEEELFALFSAHGEGFDGGGEEGEESGRPVGFVFGDVGVFGLFLLGVGEDLSGFPFDEPGEGAESDSGLVHIEFGLGEDVGEIGFADGGYGDAFELDLALADHIEEEGEGAGEGLAVNMDIGESVPAEPGGAGGFFEGARITHGIGTRRTRRVEGRV